MNHSSIPMFRLVSQRLIDPQYTSTNSVVSWMVAMQAQDFPMARWAVGLRSPGMTEAQVNTALDKGLILRTHLLRPTWHFVTPEDISWLLDLSAPQVIASQRARDRQLELTPEVYSRSNAIIEQALKLHGQLTREQLLVKLNHSGIATDQNRSAHLLMRAELEKIICSGAVVRGKPAYAMLAERAPKSRHLAKEEALAELAMRYFMSRCPATEQDFAWWSGLSARDARQAVESVKSSFVYEQINEKSYLLPQNNTEPNITARSACMLPTYDEFLISYADRSAAIQSQYEQHMKAISDRGIFWPVIVVNGQVEGIWKRSNKKDTLVVDLQPFKPLNKARLALIEKAAARFALFQDKKQTVIVSSKTN